MRFSFHKAGCPPGFTSFWVFHEALIQSPNRREIRLKDSAVCLQSSGMESPQSRRLLLFAVIGYSLFVAANSFILREPTLLLHQPIDLADRTMRAFTYFPFAIASITLGLLALKYRFSLLRLLPMLSICTFAIGTTGTGLAFMFLHVATPILLPSLAILGCYVSLAFLGWISFAMQLERDDLWIFIITSSLLSTLVGFVGIALANYVPGLLIFGAISIASVTLLYKTRIRELAETKTMEECDDTVSAPKIFFTHGPIILSLGSLGFVSSLSRLIFDNVSFAAAITAETAAVILAGIVLLLVAVVARADINIKNVIVWSVPVVSVMCLLVPLSGPELHCAFLGISTTCYTTGLLLLQIVSNEYGKERVWLSSAAYGIISGSTCVLASLGYFTPLSEISHLSNLPEYAIAALICMAVLVFSLIVERAIKTTAEAKVQADPGTDLSTEAILRQMAEEYSLTQRETEVLLLMANGRDIPTISKILVLSQNTIRTHCKHIFAKMHVHTRQECLDIIEMKKRLSM